jgi:hypothetical protein
MATSTGEALLGGLERGFRLGMEIEDRKTRQQETKRQQARQERQDWLQDRRMAQDEERQAKADERLAKQDRRQEDEDALKALDQEGLMLRGEMGRSLQVQRRPTRQGAIGPLPAATEQPHRPAHEAAAPEVGPGGRAREAMGR